MAQAFQQIKRVAISTGGGDAPGLNAVIRAAVLSGLKRGWEMYGMLWRRIDCSSSGGYPVRSTTLRPALIDR